MNASLDEKLKNVKWGEYKLGDLFSSESGDFDIQKTHINDKGDYVITAGLTNNGVLGKSDINAKKFNSGTITVDMFGYAFYRQFKYKMVTHARVFSLSPRFQINKNIGLFLASSFHSFSKKFGYENMCSWDKIKSKTVFLPSKGGKIDFAFMDSFIATLEAERMTKLSAYLTASGLSNCNLSPEELDALRIFRKLGNEDWGEYRMGDLFERIPTTKLPYKAEDLPKQATGKYVLPCLTSSFQNQGLNYYAPREGATVLRHVISLPSNSDVYRAYYQSREFTVLSDAYAIRWKSDETALTPNQYLFMVMCINKVTDLPIYSYKNKLGGWNVVKNKYIKLPQKDGSIDFAFMDAFISAMRKQAIQDVVRHVDKQIKAAKEIASE